MTKKDDNIQKAAANVAQINANFSYLDTEVKKKVEKVEGKGLSTNDYTTAEKNKLAGIAANADVSLVQGIQVNGSDLTPDANKKVNVVIPSADSYTIDETSTSAGMLKTYGLFKNGTLVSGSIIDIPKDYLLKSATVEICATANVPISGLKVGDPYLDLVFNTKDSSTPAGDTHQYVSLAGLVDIYTAGTGINVSASNEISIDTSVVAQKSDISDMASKTWVGQQGFLTQHQDITGKQDIIDDSNKLSADLVDDTSTTHKFVTAAEKSKIDEVDNKVNNSTYTADMSSVNSAISEKANASDVYTKTEIDNYIADLFDGTIVALGGNS